MDKELTCADSVIEEFSRKLKVCGHPVRLKLLCLIYRQGEPCVTNLWTCIGQSQPVISQHLAVLKENGVVDSVVQGNKRIYTIADVFIHDLVAKMIAENSGGDLKVERAIV
ncbi:MAG: transcriptional regulator [Treponema sp. RIFOXYC1_FULL_61_9]|nr:MAG: transcriptional regulator [Treponema sp. GWA1_62_8]OHE71156.1 MAG: transcriptional regulator [Treponema sp. RIFOXYC1_FULL_61_9]